MSMDKKKGKKLLFSCLAIVLLAALGLCFLLKEPAIFFGQKLENNAGSLPAESAPSLIVKEDFPLKVIDAQIESISGGSLPATLVVNAKLDSIFVNPPETTKQLLIEINQGVIFTHFDLTTKEEENINFGDLQEGDQIVIELIEGENRNILDVNGYSSIRRVTKMTGNPS